MTSNDGPSVDGASAPVAYDSLCSVTVSVCSSLERVTAESEWSYGCVKGLL